MSEVSEAEMIALLEHLQEVAFEGCGYCLISPEDRDLLLAHLRKPALTVEQVVVPDHRPYVEAARQKFNEMCDTRIKGYPSMDACFLITVSNAFAAYWNEQALPLASPASSAEAKCGVCGHDAESHTRTGCLIINCMCGRPDCTAPALSAEDAAKALVQLTVLIREGSHAKVWLEDLVPLRNLLIARGGGVK